VKALKIIKDYARMGLKFTYKDFKELGQYCRSFIGGSFPYNLLLDRFKTLSLGILLHIEGEIDPLNWLSLRSLNYNK